MQCRRHTDSALDNVARHGFFFVGGKYVGELGANKESTMGGAMYVEVMVPKQIRSPYPVVLIHGAAQTGVDWLLTPDGRPGWAYNFLDMGYVVYLQDGPARGRSQYVPGVDGTAGNLNLLHLFQAQTLEKTRFTRRAVRFRLRRSTRSGAGLGRMATQSSQYLRGRKCSSSLALVGRADARRKRRCSAIGGPVILVTHSQSGPFGWARSRTRPNQVKAVIVAVEPGGPRSRTPTMRS